MESGPAKYGRECEEEKHGVEQNESGNCGIGVLKENHHRHKPDCWPPEVQLSRGVICQRDTKCPEGGIEYSHKGIVQLSWVCFSGFEFERTVVSCQITRKSNKHLPERRMHIEVELAFEIVGTEFTKTIVDSSQRRFVCPAGAGPQGCTLGFSLSFVPGDYG